MPIEAMVDLTGGLAERYELRHSSTHRTLYKYLRKSFASQVPCSKTRSYDVILSTELGFNVKALYTFLLRH